MAGAVMSLLNFDISWLLLEAGLKSQRAARVEIASHGRICRTG